MAGASLSLAVLQLALTLALGLGKQLLVTALSNTQQVAVSSLSRQLLIHDAHLPGAFDDRSRAEIDLEKG